MKRLVPLLIAAPLMVACGSDSSDSSSSGGDSNTSTSKQPTLPQIQVKSTNNSTVNNTMNLASGMASSLTTQLSNSGVKPSYNNNSGSEIWTYSVNGTTLRLEYQDGDSEDTWKLYIDGKQGDTTVNNWLAWQVVEQDSDDSAVVSMFHQNSTELSFRISSADKRASFEQFSANGNLETHWIVHEESETSGRYVAQQGSEQVVAMVWSNDSLTIYNNCGTDITAAIIADLATSCSANQSQVL
ncbi:hypothetical protein [Bacterioplanoides sp.]|uniref:hypothetical protein n=1 Tax=Bacterioplanoides sp. TaxID=2066072 RepID=UPI003B5C2671